MRTRLNLALWFLLIPWFIYTVWFSTLEQHQNWLSTDAAFQWMLGHAYVKGEATELYLVPSGERWLSKGYDGPDLERMKQKLFRKGREKQAVRDNIDGPLYPPTAGLVFAWLGSFSPRTAHMLAIILQIVFTILTALLIPGITGSRVRAAEAAWILCLFPHHFPGMMLGQHHAFSLFILVAGWWLLAHRRPWWAGLVWGIFIIKPVILVALLLVPMALLQWRTVIGMLITSIVLVMATLPFTQGIEPWKRWVTVGQRASLIYELDRRWIWMSRDLAGLPRRAMWTADEWTTQASYTLRADTQAADFAAVYLETTAAGRVQSPAWATYTGWGLLLGVALITLLVMWKQDDDMPLDGAAAAFLLLGVCFSIFHFMHYDLILMALPVLLLVSQWQQLRRPLRVILGFVLLVLLLATLNFHRVPQSSLLTIPWETFALLGLWIFLAIGLAFPWLTARLCYSASPPATLHSAG